MFLGSINCVAAKLLITTVLSIPPAAKGEQEVWGSC